MTREGDWLSRYQFKPSSRHGILVPSSYEPQPVVPTEQHLAGSGLIVDSPDHLYALRALLRTLRVRDFLALVSAVSWEGLTEPERLATGARRVGWDPRVRLRDFQLAFAARTILDGYGEGGDRTWPDDFGQQMATLNEVCALVNLVWPDCDRAVQTLPQPEREGTLMLRHAFRQFIDFDDADGLLARGALIFLDMGPEAGREKGVNLDEALQAIIGLNLREWFALACALHLLFVNEALRFPFTVDLAAESEHDRPRVRELLPRFLEKLTVAAEAFATACPEHTVRDRPGYELYNFNPLVSWPIVGLPGGEYVVPSARLFLRRISLGPFYDFLRPHEQHGRTQEAVGRAVELYVRRLVEDLPVHGAISRADEDAPNDTRCDWVIDDPEAVLLIECKRRSLTKDAKVTGDRALITAELQREGSVARAVGQIAATADVVRAGRLPGVPTDKPVIGLVVAQDWFYFANHPYMRSVMETIIRERQGTMPPTPYQVCALSDLEDLCKFAAWSRRSLSDLLTEKMNHNEFASWDTSQWVRDVLWTADARRQAAGLSLLPSHDRAFAELLPQAVGTLREKGT
jgi:hypothetical protein